MLHLLLRVITLPQLIQFHTINLPMLLTQKSAECQSLIQLWLSNGTVVPGVQVAQCWDNVRYCGCRSGCVQPGRIFSTDWCGKVEGILFCNQILFMTNPNPIGGDSGSLLINSDTNRATGLVFARIGNIFGLANHIRPVLNNLGVALA